MRTNIEIDDALMSEAMAVTQARTKREVVEEGLRTLVRLAKQARIRELRGALAWEGDLHAARLD